MKEQGFTGRHPHFRRKLDNCIELISFQTNKWGGSFVIEVSAVFPGSDNPNYRLYEGVTEDTFGVEATGRRHRLPGMYNGWFYYRDVYRERVSLFRSWYHDVPQKEAADYVPPKGYKLVQKFNGETAVQICREVNAQLKDAMKWLADFEMEQAR